eukprot:TRINITY_DN14502_c0_g2_i1.p2 TRINITY_DN14502_c0_g2~~TRINITY_DN14502_c0_g2_i1.p2  ORF type:complete len:116 (-),score=5.29 TRINITY_DN14502_c0_g2_i1:365-712(-)
MGAGGDSELLCIDTEAYELSEGGSRVSAGVASIHVKRSRTAVVTSKLEEPSCPGHGLLYNCYLLMLTMPIAQMSSTQLASLLSYSDGRIGMGLYGSKHGRLQLLLHSFSSWEVWK